MELLERILAARQHRVVVRTRDLDPGRWQTGGEEGTPAGPTDRVLSGAERPELDTPYLAPRDDLEIRICEILQELLGITPIGVHDHFYELGGHSLLVTQAVSRLQAELDIELPLDQMLSGPTVAELATHIAIRQAEQADADLAEMVAEIQDLSPEDLQALLDAEATEEN
jgi:acyl carrier protein